MNRIPKRVLLVRQVIDILREDLRTGRWREWLPSEQSLAQELRVSRKPVRAALAVLQRDGLISSSQGRRRRILVQARRAPVKSDLVGWLAPAPWHAISPFGIFCIGEVRRYLQDVGRELVFQVDPTLRSRRGLTPADALRALVRNTRASGWVLGSAREEVQRWFWRNQIPTLVFGSTYEAMHLPCLDLDFHAGCRHAVGTLFRWKHRCIALIVPKTNLAGHLAMERGFKEGFTAARDQRAVPLVVRHDGSVEDIRRAVDGLFRSRPGPTAILAAIPRHVLTILSHLATRGIRVPRDVSLISLEFDWFLRDLAFSVAHYEVKIETMAGHLARQTAMLATTGALPPRRTLFIPRFTPGDTLGPAPR